MSWRRVYLIFLVVLAIAAFLGGVAASGAAAKAAPKAHAAWRATAADARRIANDVNARNCGNGWWWNTCHHVMFIGPAGDKYRLGRCYKAGNHSWYCDAGMREVNRAGFSRWCNTRVHVFHIGPLHYRKCGKLLW